LTFPVAEELSKEGLNLPSGSRLSKNEIEEIVRNLDDFVSTRESRVSA